MHVTFLAVDGNKGLVTLIRFSLHANITACLGGERGTLRPADASLTSSAFSALYVVVPVFVLFAALAFRDARLEISDVVASSSPTHPLFGRGLSHRAFLLPVFGYDSQLSTRCGFRTAKAHC